MLERGKLHGNADRKLQIDTQNNDQQSEVATLQNKIEELRSNIKEKEENPFAFDPDDEVFYACDDPGFSPTGIDCCLVYCQPDLLQTSCTVLTPVSRGIGALYGTNITSVLPSGYSSPSDTGGSIVKTTIINVVLLASSLFCSLSMSAENEQGGAQRSAQLGTLGSG